MPRCADALSNFLRRRRCIFCFDGVGCVSAEPGTDVWLRWKRALLQVVLPLVNALQRVCSVFLLLAARAAAPCNASAGSAAPPACAALSRALLGSSTALQRCDHTLLQYLADHPPRVDLRQLEEALPPPAGLGCLRACAGRWAAGLTGRGGAATLCPRPDGCAARGGLQRWRCML